MVPGVGRSSELSDILASGSWLAARGSVAHLPTIIALHARVVAWRRAILGLVLGRIAVKAPASTTTIAGWAVARVVAHLFAGVAFNGIDVPRLRALPRLMARLSTKLSVQETRKRRRGFYLLAVMTSVLVLARLWTVSKSVAVFIAVEAMLNAALWNDWWTRVLAVLAGVSKFATAVATNCPALLDLACS